MAIGAFSGKAVFQAPPSRMQFQNHRESATQSLADYLYVCSTVPIYQSQSTPVRQPDCIADQQNGLALVKQPSKIRDAPSAQQLAE